MVYLSQGLLDKALPQFEKAVDLSRRNPHVLASLGHALALAGNTAQAEAVLSELKERSARSYVPPYSIALVYAGLGQDEPTFEWLERGYEERSTWMIFLNVAPWFERLRPDPRFQKLVHRMGLAR